MGRQQPVQLGMGKLTVGQYLRGRRPERVRHPVGMALRSEDPGAVVAAAAPPGRLLVAPCGPVPEAGLAQQLLGAVDPSVVAIAVGR